MSGCPNAHPKGRNEVSTRSEAESCAAGSRGTIVSTEELVEYFGRNGTKWNGGRSLILLSVTNQATSLPLFFNGRVLRDAYSETSFQHVNHILI